MKTKLSFFVLASEKKTREIELISEKMSAAITRVLSQIGVLLFFAHANNSSKIDIPFSDKCTSQEEEWISTRKSHKNHSRRTSAAEQSAALIIYTTPENESINLRGMICFVLTGVSGL
jgi:hypothetical protein